jgi:hypothetical protein
MQRREGLMRDRMLWAVVCGGLVAGTLDIGAGALINAVSPLLVLQFIASGVLGKAAYQAGIAGVALGLGLQWAMSLLIAAIYVAARRWLAPVRNLLTRSWLLGGVLAGVVIFVVMSFIVLPLSAAVPQLQPTALGAVENLLAMLGFGLIIAFAAHRYDEGAQQVSLRSSAAT